MVNLMGLDYDSDPIVTPKTPPPPPPSDSVAITATTSNAKPTDNAANIAVHKARYLHFIHEKYLSSSSMNGAAMRKSRAEHFIGILEKRVTGTAKERHIIKERKFKVHYKNSK